MVAERTSKTSERCEVQLLVMNSKILLTFFLLFFLLRIHAEKSYPNVVFIITDDQGYGDLGFTGNPIIQTPHLDQLAKESVWLTDFHVAPSCSPTRSSLLTGRWTNRTGVWHTFFARAMMYEDEVTLADHFRAAGYSTGMFGKWHLGDHYPYRPQDRGFDEVYCIKGGAIGVTADYWNNDYFDDHYYHNEKVVKASGYCTDVFFEESSHFIRKQVDAKKPFFAYISTNAPHKPWICPPKYSALYPKQSKAAAAFYGMVTNIDANIGKLREILSELKVEHNTLLIFTTDNGSVGPKKFNAGMRGGKISPYEGGHRVPFAIHWPAAGYNKHTAVNELTHMVDVLPTLLELCRLPVARESLDGRSIVNLLDGKGDDSFDWEKRIVVSDSQRIQIPKKCKDSAVMQGKWRLVKGTELYHIGNDPGQKNNIAEKHPKQFSKMRHWYENWWAELKPSFTRTSEIYIGSDEAAEVNLTALQWIDAPPPWNQGIIRRGPSLKQRSKKKLPNPKKFSGHWAVNVNKAGSYIFELRRWPKESGLKILEGTTANLTKFDCLPSYSAVAGTALPISYATLRINGEEIEKKSVRESDESIKFTHKLNEGSHKFSPFFTIQIKDMEHEIGCYYLSVKSAELH